MEKNGKGLHQCVKYINHHVFLVILFFSLKKRKCRSLQIAYGSCSLYLEGHVPIVNSETK